MLVKLIDWVSEIYSPVSMLSLALVKLTDWDSEIYSSVSMQNLTMGVQKYTALFLCKSLLWKFRDLQHCFPAKLDDGDSEILYTALCPLINLTLEVQRYCSAPLLSLTLKVQRYTALFLCLAWQWRFRDVQLCSSVKLNEGGSEIYSSVPLLSLTREVQRYTALFFC